MTIDGKVVENEIEAQVELSVGIGEHQGVLNEIEAQVELGIKLRNN